MREKLLKQFFVLIIMLTLFSNTANAKLVGHWAFDEKSGSWARDTCGRNDANVILGNMWRPAGGRVGGALEFDDVKEYVEIPYDSVFSFDEEMTVGCWINISEVDTTSNRYILGRIISKNNAGWWLVWNKTKKFLRFKCHGLNSKEIVECSDIITEGKWHHVAGVRDGKKLYIYIDGKLGNSTEVTGVMPQAESPIYIGAIPNGKSYPFEGLVDDVTIFDHALSEKEINQLITQGVRSFASQKSISVLDIKKALEQKKPLEAIKFLENKIVEMEGRSEKHPDNLAHSDSVLISEFYYMLAQSMEGAGMPEQEIVEAYKKVTCRPMSVPNCINVFLWLFENLNDNEKVEIVRKSVAEGDSTVQNVYYIADYLRENEDKDEFKCLLKGILSANISVEHTNALLRGAGEDNEWLGLVWGFCLDSNELTPSAMYIGDMLAEHYAKTGDVLKAASIYQDMKTKSTNDQHKIKYEFREMECLFKEERYSEVLPKLQGFVEKNKSAHRTLVIPAMMMLGRIQIQLGDLEKAVSILLKLTIEYPTSIEAGEATYLMGYCYLLQNKFESAKDAFNLVVKEYSGNGYTKKARKYLKRISSFNK